MSNYARPQLIEALAAAETNYQIARREQETAWKNYDNAVEWRLAEMVTQDTVEHAASLAEATDEYLSECYARYNALVAQLLERDEIAAALDAAKASLATSRIIERDLMSRYINLRVYSPKTENTDEYIKAYRYVGEVLDTQIAAHL